MTGRQPMTSYKAPVHGTPVDCGSERLARCCRVVLFLERRKGGKIKVEREKGYRMFVEKDSGVDKWRKGWIGEEKKNTRRDTLKSQVGVEEKRTQGETVKSQVAFGRKDRRVENDLCWSC